MGFVGKTLAFDRDFLDLFGMMIGTTGINVETILVENMRILR